MNKEYPIQIPNPCHADWNSMTPNDTGRHCDLCNKTVVDFTTMSTEEIKQYFIANTGKKTCGHFYKGQLKNDKNKIQSTIYDLYCNAYLTLKNRAFRILALLILGGFLTLTGCNTPTKGEIMKKQEQLTGDSVVASPADTMPKDIKK